MEALLRLQFVLLLTNFVDVPPVPEQLPPVRGRELAELAGKVPHLGVHRLLVAVEGGLLGGPVRALVALELLQLVVDRVLVPEKEVGI